MAVQAKKTLLTPAVALYDVSSGPITGCALAAAVRSGYLQRLFPARVARNPNAAKARIEECFGCYPNQGGTNVEGIVAMRDTLHALTREQRHADALVIVAPHTHWSFATPIVVRRSGDDYAVGPCEPRPDETYTPVSFVFSAAGPLAFEWADGSVALSAADFAEILSVVHRLNMALHDNDWPLGVSLNFRFKELFSDRMIATVEFPLDDDEDTAMVVPLDRYFGEPLDPREAQVAWHAHSDLAYGLDEDGLCLLRAMRKRLEREERA